MEKQLLASRRPWVGVNISLTGDMEAAKHGYDVRLKYTDINPFIMGCVTYRSTFDDTVHRTPFRVQLVRDDPKTIGNFLSLNTSIGTIPMKSIFVKPEISIGGIRTD